MRFALFLRAKRTVLNTWMHSRRKTPLKVFNQHITNHMDGLFSMFPFFQDTWFKPKGICQNSKIDADNLLNFCLISYMYFFILMRIIEECAYFILVIVLCHNIELFDYIPYYHSFNAICMGLKRHVSPWLSKLVRISQELPLWRQAAMKSLFFFMLFVHQNKLRVDMTPHQALDWQTKREKWQRVHMRPLW